MAVLLLGRTSHWTKESCQEATAFFLFTMRNPCQAFVPQKTEVMVLCAKDFCGARDKHTISAVPSRANLFASAFPVGLAGGMIGKVPRTQNAKRHILVQLPGDLPRTEHPTRVCVHQHLQQHPGIVGTVAPPVSFVAHVKALHIQSIHDFRNEIG